MREKFLNLLDSFKEHQISAELHTYRARIVSMLHSSYFSDRIKPYFATMHAEGVPFTNFADQPRQVIQIKEIINALYHAEQAFLDLEAVNLRNGQNKIGDVQTLYSHTIEHSYKASYLLTHLDIELSELFANEIKMVLPLLSAFQNFADHHTNDAMQLTEKLKQYPFGYKAGLISGIAVDQMKPDSGQVDYSFLTQLGAVLPGYLQQFTQLIHQYSPQPLTRFQATLDNTGLEALRLQGFYLLSNLENLQDQGILISAKVFNYANAIRRVINISMSILEQLQNLNGSSQDIIRENLAALKYECLVPLLALADRIEDEALLAPGTLSTPLMGQVKPLYDFLIKYASMVVDFSEKGRELLSVEDDHFVHLRLAETERRVANSKLNLIKIEQAQADLEVFLNLLDETKDTLYLIDLPAETKKNLATHYRLLEPYVKKIDSALNNNIIKALTLEPYWNIRLINPFSPAHESVVTKTVFNFAGQLRTLLTKDYNTQTFHIELNEDLISSVHQRADLNLFPYDRESNIQNCNEAAVLKIDPSSANAARSTTEQVIDASSANAAPLTTEQVIDPSSVNTAPLTTEQAIDPSSVNTAPLTTEQAIDPSPANDFNFNVQGKDCYITNTAPLTTEQAFELYQLYTDKLAKLERARAAFIQFMTIIKAQHPKLLKDIDKETKALLRNLYCRFQPYIVDIIMAKTKYDSLIVANLAELSDKPGTKKPKPLSTRYFLSQERERAFLSSLSTLAVIFQQRADYFRGPAGAKYKATAHARELKPDETNDSRASFLLKDTKYSEAIAGFRNSVLQLRAFFNTTTRKQLKPTQYYIRSGAPYPELESNISILKESKQVLAVKYIHNSLYHIEEVINHLEALNDKSTQSVYVYHLIQIYNHLEAIVRSGKELRKDPYLALLVTDMSNRASEIYQMLLTRSEPYTTSPDLVSLPTMNGATEATPDPADKLSTVQSQKVQYGGIWYPLNAFMLVPAHIQSLTAEKALPQAEKEKIQKHTKQITLGIEAVIRDSGSYFQLFLKTPVMQHLFLELRGKLKEFTTITRGAVLKNLKKLNTEHFAKILLEADEWEDRMGLRPGLLSGPMKLVLDEFYRGLVEPLGFVSQKHVDLISSLEPIEKRLAQVRKRKEQAKREKEPYIGDHTIMAKLMKRIATYEQFNTGPAPHPLAMQAVEEELVAAYKLAVPILKKHRELFALLREDEVENSAQLDRFIARSVAESVDDAQVSIPLNPPSASSHHQLALALAADQSQVESSAERQIQVEQPFELTEHIKTHCRLVFNYYQGHINTHDTNIATAEEKESYLVNLRKKQKAQNKQFVIDYVQKMITQQIEVASNRYIGLLHVRDEYNDKLREYLESQRVSIAEQAQRVVDIDSFVQKLIAQKVLRFDQESYREYAHLESVMVSLNEFNAYFTEANGKVLAGSSYFETITTLHNKTLLIEGLGGVALDRTKSVHDRLHQMARTDDYGFRTTMLAHLNPEPYTLAWLIQQVTELLSMLRIYKPGYKRCFEGFDSALKSPPSEQAINRWRLFEAPKAKRRYALPPQILAVGRADQPPAAEGEEAPVQEPGDVPIMS